MRDDSPTPPSWLSYRVFTEEARRFADRMETVALVSRKRLDVLDYRRAKRADEIAERLRGLARAFSLWDSSPAEQVALERSLLIPELTGLLREAIAMLEGMPSHPALGPIRMK